MAVPHDFPAADRPAGQGLAPPDGFDGRFADLVVGPDRRVPVGAVGTHLAVVPGVGPRPAGPRAAVDPRRFPLAGGSSVGHPLAGGSSVGHPLTVTGPADDRADPVEYAHRAP
ncbi:hypothetical protein BRD00_04640 [Halobacteriales archaeon QS_8_69_26]|nr:MAG: hypothetical protein BRD00_04640 [Halobacteriales archaeon QS_8_69_26]